MMNGNKETMVVSFSGGNTSRYMCVMLKNSYSHIYDFKFIYANTGLEDERTLEFINDCDLYYGLDLVWIEAVVNPAHGKGITHKVVSFSTASRKGEPFEDHIAKSGIPNANKPQCSDRLKALPIEHYKKVHGLTGCKHAIGMRADEMGRILSKTKRDLLVKIGIDADEWRVCKADERSVFLFNASDKIESVVSNIRRRYFRDILVYEKVSSLKVAELKKSRDSELKKFRSGIKSLYNHNKFNLIYPLCDFESVDKIDVEIFSEMEPVTLDLEPHQGNCSTCWKKSDKKLWLISLESPDKFDFMRRMEKQYQHVKPNNDGKPRNFFRKHRSVDDLFKESSLMDEYTLRKTIGYSEDSGGCSEHCEAYTEDLV